MRYQLCISAKARAFNHIRMPGVFELGRTILNFWCPSSATGKPEHLLIDTTILLEPVNFIQTREDFLPHVSAQEWGEPNIHCAPGIDISLFVDTADYGILQNGISVKQSGQRNIMILYHMGFDSMHHQQSSIARVVRNRW